MNTTTLLSFTLISIAVCSSPGPSMFFVLLNGLSGDKRHGLAAVLSLTSANIIWVTLSATGVAAIIYNSIVAFEILRISGAAYLIYSGIQLWRTGLNINIKNSQITNIVTIFLKGLTTSLSNPKALIFYISFLPQFINKHEPCINQIITLGGIYILVVFLVMSFYAFLSNYLISILRNQFI